MSYDKKQDSNMFSIARVSFEAGFKHRRANPEMPLDEAMAEFEKMIEGFIKHLKRLTNNGDKRRDH